MLLVLMTMVATLDIDKEMLKMFCVKQIKQTNPQMCLFSTVKHEEAMFQYKCSVAFSYTGCSNGYMCVTDCAHSKSAPVEKINNCELPNHNNSVCCIWICA